MGSRCVDLPFDVPALASFQGLQRMPNLRCRCSIIPVQGSQFGQQPMSSRGIIWLPILDGTLQQFVSQFPRLAEVSACERASGKGIEQRVGDLVAYLVTRD